MKRDGGRPGIHSITWQLFSIIAGCILLLLAAVFALNTLALKGYYVYHKEKQVSAAFDTIDGACRDQTQLQEALSSLQDTDTVSIVLWKNRDILYSTHNSDRVMIPMNVNEEPGTYTLTVTENGAMLFGEEPGTQTIRLVGTLSNGWHIYLRTPVAAIQESVAITNRFLLLSGGFALMLSLVVTLIASRRFTQPIRQVAAEADRVARLDFSNRQPIAGHNEVALLGHRVRTMSQALEQTIDQLQQANRQLMEDIAQKEEQDRARRAFIANVSHELKTPLALISSYAEGLREDIAGDSKNRDYYCEVIEDESVKINQLLRRMTMLMQLESGGEQLESQCFDVAELLRNLMDKLSPQLEQKHATAQLSAWSPVPVLADPYLIENVMQNFLQNALHHVTDGGEVAVNLHDCPGGRVRVEVYNTGQHVPDDDLPRIWESFYKVDKARTRTYGGSGIGLSVVAAIMRAHGMPYGVENRPHGVAFFVELPQGEGTFPAAGDC